MFPSYRPSSYRRPIIVRPTFCLLILSNPWQFIVIADRSVVQQSHSIKLISFIMFSIPYFVSFHADRFARHLPNDAPQLALCRMTWYFVYPTIGSLCSTNSVRCTGLILTCVRGDWTALNKHINSVARAGRPGGPRQAAQRTMIVSDRHGDRNRWSDSQRNICFRSISWAERLLLRRFVSINTTIIIFIR